MWDDRIALWLVLDRATLSSGVRELRCESCLSCRYALLFGKEKDIEELVASSTKFSYV